MYDPETGEFRGHNWANRDRSTYPNLPEHLTRVPAPPADPEHAEMGDDVRQQMALAEDVGALPLREGSVEVAAVLRGAGGGQGGLVGDTHIRFHGGSERMLIESSLWEPPAAPS